MSVTDNYLSDDWGWYVDIENINPIIQNRNESVMSHKKKYRYLNNLETIKEEFDNDDYDDYDEYHKYNKYELNNMELKNITFTQIFNVSSTTMITVLIIYTVFFMI